MPIGLKDLGLDLRALVMGSMLGNVYFVDGTNGDAGANGKDLDHAMATLHEAESKTLSGHQDYILACGAQTVAAGDGSSGTLALTKANLHILGVGGGGMLSADRGFRLTCLATVDTITLSTAADNCEIAGIHFSCSATDHILIDDAGAQGCIFHNNTVFGSTTASDAVRLDIEGAKWAILNNNFWLCKLAIDLAGAENIVKGNMIQDQDTAAKGVVLGASAHRSIIEGNVFNLGGGTGDVGITITSSADYCVIKDNVFHGDVSDAISDAGTDTMIVGNLTTAIDGATGASLLKAIND